MNEKDLCDIRDAMAGDNLTEAVEATEKALDEMGYIHRSKLAEEGYFQAVPFQKQGCLTNSL